MKWVRQHEGPYLVLKMLSPLKAKIQLSARSKPKIVHVDKLKLFDGDPPKSWMTDHTSQARGDPVEQDRPDPDLESWNEDRTNESALRSKGSLCADNSVPHNVEGRPRVKVETSNFGEEFEGRSNVEFDRNSESEFAASRVHRPARTTKKPSRYQDNEFQMQLRPKQKTRRRELRVESQNTNAIQQPSFNSRGIQGNARQNFKVRQHEQTPSNHTASKRKFDSLAHEYSTII